MECIEGLLAEGEDVSLIRVDGMPIWNPDYFPVPTEFLPKGDLLVWAIGAASIIAKVDRDAWITEQSAAYPVYGWASNKAYGSKEHIEAILKHGVSPLHRKSFCRGFVQVGLSDDMADLFCGE
jgi:ribonuclease HII